uniref:Uncharacterized protein n=1 Tax=Arundo donax TaxID=35708 RepID=A0A0A8XUR4_ARUDO
MINMIENGRNMKTIEKLIKLFSLSYFFLGIKNKNDKIKNYQKNLKTNTSCLFRFSSKTNFKILIILIFTFIPRFSIQIDRSVLLIPQNPRRNLVKPGEAPSPLTYSASSAVIEAKDH